MWHEMPLWCQLKSTRTGNVGSAWKSEAKGIVKQKLQYISCRNTYSMMLDIIMFVLFMMTIRTQHTLSSKSTEGTNHSAGKIEYLQRKEEHSRMLGKKERKTETNHTFGSQKG